MITKTEQLAITARKSATEGIWVFDGVNRFGQDGITVDLRPGASYNRPCNAHGHTESRCIHTAAARQADLIARGIVNPNDWT